MGFEIVKNTAPPAKRPIHLKMGETSWLFFPLEPFNSFRASNSVNWRTLSCKETSIDGPWNSNILKGLVGLRPTQFFRLLTVEISRTFIPWLIAITGHELGLIAPLGCRQQKKRPHFNGGFSPQLLLGEIWAGIKRRRKKVIDSLCDSAPRKQVHRVCAVLPFLIYADVHGFFFFFFFSQGRAYLTQGRKGNLLSFFFFFFLFLSCPYSFPPPFFYFLLHLLVHVRGGAKEGCVPLLLFFLLINSMQILQYTSRYYRLWRFPGVDISELDWQSLKWKCPAHAATCLPAFLHAHTHTRATYTVDSQAYCLFARWAFPPGLFKILEPCGQEIGIFYVGTTCDGLWSLKNMKCSVGSLCSFNCSRICCCVIIYARIFMAHFRLFSTTT